MRLFITKWRVAINSEKRNLQHWYCEPSFCRCGYFAFVFCISWKLIEEKSSPQGKSTLYWKVPATWGNSFLIIKRSITLIQTFIMLVNWAPVKGTETNDLLTTWSWGHIRCWEVLLSPWDLMGRSDRFPGRGMPRKQLVQQAEGSRWYPIEILLQLYPVED